MRITIEKKYLVFPTNAYAKKKRIRFFDEGKEVYYLNACLDGIAPDFYGYADMRRFIGKTLDMQISPDTEIVLEQVDFLPESKDDGLRPYIHFTTKRGWLNDPNGLVKVGDEWHLFYQYNPLAKTWENMHWGHAVSKDLFRWEERPIALFPDETGTMYSGCALVDEKNASGLGKDGKTAVLLYYTAAGVHASVPMPYTQALAYSLDGLQTVEKYQGNPVISHIAGGNRDPKVVWCEELHAYLMSLYLDGDEFALFTSTNLLAWQELQRVRIPSESECPNVYPLVASDGKRKWVFIGAHEVYAVGEFQNGKFVESQPLKRISENTDSYAAQVYTDLPENRVIRVAWNRWGGMVGDTYSQQMGIPCEVRLECRDGEYYLTYSPVAELNSIVESVEEYENLDLREKRRFALGRRAVGLYLHGEYAQSGKIRLVLFGNEIVFDFEKNEIDLNGIKNPLTITRERLGIMVIADRSGIEIFADGGKIAFAVCAGAVCDQNLSYLEMESDGKYRLEKLTIEKYVRTCGV